MNKISFTKAKALSILKWKLIIKNKGKVLEFYPKELCNIINNCGFCQYMRLDGMHICQTCPLAIETHDDIINCMYRNHPYSNWCKEENIESAKLVLEAIKATKKGKLLNEKYSICK